MAKRNPHLAKLQAGYLFPEIARRKLLLQRQKPGVKIISLGIGNTTEPLTPYITAALQKVAGELGTKEGYSGYGPEQGIPELRAKIASQLYKGIVKEVEVFVSDGAKCDIGRLQLLFGSQVTVAVQDPAYPVYVDGSVIIGASGSFDKSQGNFSAITYMSCRPENDFFPALKAADIIYFCSPNNPTGATATKEQLTQLVGFARKHRAIIIFDAAYACFIKDSSLPRSIFEIEGAREAAIEVNSFSKSLGFTGVRLGWTVVPDELRFDDGTPVRRDWNRIMTTLFNGASIISQRGGLASLDKQGRKEMQETIDYYMENARIIRSCLEELGMTAYGGENAPYIWAMFPGKNSWEAFDAILTNCHVVTTPGSGFGPCGEGFLRFSAFAHRKDVLLAVERLKESLG